MPYKTFQRGSGCYTCTCCGKRTRDTGYGEADLNMCLVCYEIGGAQNSLSDSGHPDPWDDAIFDDCKTSADVNRVMKEEAEKHDLTL